MNPTEIKSMDEAAQLIGQRGDLLSTHEMNGDDPPHVMFPDRLTWSRAEWDDLKTGREGQPID